MKTRRARLKFYRKVRTALLATNKKTDSAIITACHTAMPIASDKGITVENKGFTRKRILRNSKSSNVKRCGTGSRVVKF